MTEITHVSTKITALALLCGIIASGGCGTLTGVGTDKRPVDVASLNQCNREMTALDQQVAEMEALLKSGEPAANVLEAAQRLRGEIPAVEMKCNASEAALTELKKLDKDLAALMKRLEVEGYR